MSVDEKRRSRRPRGRLRRIAHGLLGVFWPTQRQILTREGFIYFCVGVALLGAGLLHQVNLILLVFTLSAGPFLASIFGGRAMLHRLNVQRRLPPYVFSGEPLVIDYTVENGRRWFAALRELAAERDLAELSMGTSQDYVIAAEEGATIVRIGTKLYQ